MRCIVYNFTKMNLTILRQNLLSVIANALLFLFIGCSSSANQEKIESWKKEIVDTEAAFAQLAASKGIQSAFTAYAADDAVLKRSEKLIIGKPAIEIWLEQNRDGATGVKLSWSPDYVDVAASGDLGYTYGKYTIEVTDSLGNVKTDTGIFHTVWKRQADGSWKYVWD